MDNPFKKILHNQQLPETLKEKVLNDVAMIKLSIDMADLFVVKYPNIIGDLISGGGATESDSRKESREDNK